MSAHRSLSQIPCRSRRERYKGRQSKGRQSRDIRLLVDGGSREPLSGPNSLLTGKLTGNFAKMAQQNLEEDCSIALNQEGLRLQNQV